VKSKITCNFETLLKQVNQSHETTSQQTSILTHIARYESALRIVLVTDVVDTHSNIKELAKRIVYLAYIKI